ncbi:MAG TPA: polyprenyl synthetase family protein [Bacteriovoracaceae bacterium]|nr:polyprenyl synthetase family protein [Bacteriovoracaceae bacterium]
MLEAAIRHSLRALTHADELSEVMEYAVFPAGKLFRPKLVEALAQDLNKSLTPSHLHLATALEIHHAYTLVHDDLPAMDNDLMRRGKPSTHAAFCEWKAILAGDALLIASFAELLKIPHENLLRIHRLMSWATGAKGLIKGQYMDLEASGAFDFKKVVHIHELKTARLIQVATLGSYYLSRPELRLGEVKDYLRIGRDIGVCFQLLDDLSELTEKDVSAHEKSINPFIVSPSPAVVELTVSFKRLMTTVKRLALPKLEEMLLAYFLSNQVRLLSHFHVIEGHTEKNKELRLLKSWLTSYV